MKSSEVWRQGSDRGSSLNTDNQYSMSVSPDKYMAFAQLSSDWFWELDANLCYVYHSNHRVSPSGTSGERMVGQCRIQSVSGNVVHDDELLKHNDQLTRHAPLDVLLHWKTDDGNRIYSKVVASPRFNEHQEFTGYIGCGHDVTEEILAKEKLKHLADHDDLTGLLNRRAFEQRLEQFRVSIGKSANATTLCFLNLDQFKLINDTGGHDVGDQLLRVVAKRISFLLDSSAIIARLGGDEFGIILQSDANTACREMNRLIQHLCAAPLAWRQQKYTIGASAGIVQIGPHHRDITELLYQADTACYIAKRAGRNQAKIYTYNEFSEDPKKLELKQVSQLRHAMDNNGLVLFLQPLKASIESGQRLHFEVLLRLLDEKGNPISAGMFIPVAEKYDLMLHLDKWVVARALVELEEMLSQGIDLCLSINLSGNSLSNQECLEHIENLLIESKLDPSRICFEITETAAIKNVEQAKHFIDRLKRLGCQFSLDDFGSGLSSFGYLKSLPVDFLKIDGSFVKEMTVDPTCQAIVSAVNQLGHELGMKTVAEFVENDETGQLLTDIGVDYLQGYGIGVPRDIDEWKNLLMPADYRSGT